MPNIKSIPKFIDKVKEFCDQDETINSFTELDDPNNIEEVYGENLFRQFVLYCSGFDVTQKRAYFGLIVIDKTTDDKKSYTQHENLMSIVALRNYCYSMGFDVDFEFESEVSFLTTDKSGIGLDWAIVEFSVLIEIGTLKC